MAPKTRSRRSTSSTADRSTLRAAKVHLELELYSGAQHGFTDPQNPSDERADREYKVAMARFLKEVFGS